MDINLLMGILKDKTEIIKFLALIGDQWLSEYHKQKTKD